MKTNRALIGLSLCGLLLQANAAARPELAEAGERTELFLKLDLDHDQRVDEAELMSALARQEQRRLERVSQLDEKDAGKAKALQARIEERREDPMLGTPDKAAAFILANFDQDGDWALDQEEVGQAFSVLRKWRSEGRS
ncbi:hypothetical protein IEN85_17275 [Pelagicoccus sp. NFK12]|uniref:EF-hand domain-containing protein n=1 Tax=Pelagicoccus enzymogenes TaxID=2773457 RepID=A0A927FBC6_9BACT|nr:hypothetical protein [Pelagicoccus enzymogenes]MBD5781255.1 hypothetical protein [Pelagicoccus enzymogenes]